MSQALTTKILIGLVVTAGLSVAFLGGKVSTLSKIPTTSKNQPIERTEEVKGVVSPTYNEAEESTMAVNSVDFFNHIMSGKDPKDYDRRAYIDDYYRKQDLKRKWDSLYSDYRGLHDNFLVEADRLMDTNPDDEGLYRDQLKKFNKVAKETRDMCVNSALAGYAYVIVADSSKKSEFDKDKERDLSNCKKWYEEIDINKLDID